MTYYNSRCNSYRMAKISRAVLTLRQKVQPAMSQTALAKELGVTKQAVYAWLSGRAMPEPERMAQIETLLGIPMRDWVTEGESGQLPAEDTLDATGTDDAPS